MSGHPFTEGQRVAMDVTTVHGRRGIEIEVRTGTVVQAPSTQPHLTWVAWDNGPKWQMIGTAHLRDADA